MLQKIRDRIQGWVAIAIASLIALIFALWGLQSLRDTKKRVIAKVDGKEIDADQLMVTYEQHKYAAMLRMGKRLALDKEQQLRIKQAALQALISEKILLSAAQELGLVVGKGQLLGTMLGMPMFQTDNGFSPELYRNIIHKFYRTEQRFLEFLQAAIFSGQLEAGIAASSFVLPSEVQLFEESARQIRTFGYFRIPVDQFMGTAKVTEEEISQYYQQHQAEFTTEELVSLQYLELNSKQLSDSKNVKTSEEELRAFYQAHPHLFKTAQQWKVLKIVVPSKQSKSQKKIDPAKTKQRLEELAMLLKQGKQPALKDQSWLVSTLWVQEGQASELLTHLVPMKVGECSAPFETRDGLALVQVLAIQPARLHTYEQVIAKVRALYQQSKVSGVFNEASERLSELAYTNPSSLEPVADALNLKIASTGLFSRTGGQTGLLANEKIVTAAFSPEVLLNGYNSKLIELTNGTVIVLRVKEHLPKRFLPLAEVRTQITQRLAHEKSLVAVAQLARKVLQELSAGKSVEQLSRQYHLVWRQATSNDQAVAMLLNKVFELPRPHKQATSTDLVETKEAYYVVRLDGVSYSRETPTAAPKRIEYLANMYMYYDYLTFMEQLKRQARVKVLVSLSDEEG